MFIWLTKNSLALLAKLISGASVQWAGCKPEASCQRVYFANHTSHLDGIVIWASLPRDVREKTRLVAAKDYWEKGFVRRFLATKVFNVILVNRDNVSVHNNPLYHMLNEMGSKYSIIIFPEGSRSTTGEIGEFKSGIFYLVKKRPELELIPVYLDNMNRILPKGFFLPAPMLSRVVFGAPLWFEKKESKDNFLKRMRNSVVNLKKFHDAPDIHDDARH